MLYGPTKRRQMARSILPSRARRRARADLRLIHRRYRRRVSQQLRDHVRVLTADPTEPLDLGHRSWYPNAEIRGVVRERRDADTLNHFERWAVASTRGIPIEDRLSRLRSLLPDGLIGDHAESHLRWLPEIHPLQEHDWRYRYRSGPDSLDAERAATEAALRRALEVGLHAELNRQLRYAGSDRLLLGMHDVPEFVACIVRCGRYRCGRFCKHPVLDALRRFIERFGLSRFVRVADDETPGPRSRSRYAPVASGSREPTPGSASAPCNGPGGSPPGSERAPGRRDGE